MPSIRDVLRRHIDTCALYNKKDNTLSESVVRKKPDQAASLKENQQLDKDAHEHRSLSPAPSWDHLICQLESDSYQESIRGSAAQSLAIFVRILSTFAITGIFDPDFTLPTSASPHTTNFNHAQGNRMTSWGLPSTITLMDASGATTSCISPPSSSYDTETSLYVSQSYTLNHESPRIETLQPTQYLMGSSESWILAPEPLSFTEYDVCLEVSNEIARRIRNTIYQKPLGKAIYPREWSSQLEQEYFALFGPSSLKKYTEEYWNTWYIHWPVIHKATFRISVASAALVASMVLLGASYSSDVTTRERARYWADSVETIVFADEYFGSATVFSALNAACLERRLRALQAGHAMCIYQTFEGNLVARRRARQCRFNEVVAVS